MWQRAADRSLLASVWRGTLFLTARHVETFAAAVATADRWRPPQLARCGVVPDATHLLGAIIGRADDRLRCSAADRHSGAHPGSRRQDVVSCGPLGAFLGYRAVLYVCQQLDCRGQDRACGALVLGWRVQTQSPFSGRGVRDDQQRSAHELPMAPQADVPRLRTWPCG